MYLYVNATDWRGLSDTARTSIRRMLHEQHFLPVGQDVISTINYPSLMDRKRPSLLDPELAASLRRAVCAGLQACAIIHQVCWQGEVKETCFLVAYKAYPPLECPGKGEREAESPAE